MALVAATTLLLGACSDDPAPSTEDPPLAGDSDETAAPEQTDEQDPDEQEQEATATIEPPLDLAGTTWFPTNFSYAPGDTGITNPLDDEAYFEFRADGTLVGYMGCNDFEGTWEITGPYYDYDDAAEAFDDQHDGQPTSITAEHSAAAECEGFRARTTT